MNLIKIILSSAAVIFVLMGIPVAVYAQTATSEISDACDKAKANGAKMPAFCESYQKEQTKNPITDTISKIANILAFISGAVAVIMVMYGGFQFMTSNGDSGKVTKGRDTVLYAAVGLVVIIFARLIVNFAVMMLIK